MFGKKLLVIAPSFPPAGDAGAIRIGKLTKYLSRLGWQIDVLAPRRLEGAESDDALENELFGVRVIRVGVGLGSIPWAVTALPETLRIARGHRRLLSVSPPHSALLLGLALTKCYSLDSWVDLADCSAEGDTRIDRHVLASARLVTVGTPGLRRALVERYGSQISGKIEVLPSGFDPDDFTTEYIIRTTASHVVRPPERLEMLCADTKAMPLLDALALLLERRPDVREKLCLRILGSADDQVEAWIDTHHAQDMITCAPVTSHRARTQAMRNADAVVLSSTDDWPAKTFDSLASETPIVAIVPDGDTRNLLTDCGRSTLFRPSEARELAAYLDRSIDEHRFTPAIGANLAAIDDFALPKIATRAAHLLERV